MNKPKRGSSGGAEQSARQEKESFIDQADRPEVRIDPETPVGQLRVRELTAILGSVALKPFRWEKYFKQEKFEKNEKLEWEKLDKAPDFQLPFDPGGIAGPDPLPWREVVQVLTGLQQQVSQLANQVAELQRKVGG